MSSTSDVTLNWGIVSAGKICEDFCTALQYANSSKHVLESVAARSLDKAKAFADKFNMKNAYGSYEELYADKAVNIVYVGSINTTHISICLKAIEAGKHVLCEKPMTMNRKDQEEIFAAAKKKGVFFMEALWTRFFPIIDLLREHLEKKTIGEVRFVNTSFIVPISQVDRVKNKELGGSTIFDIGIYPIQLACMIMGHEEPIKITASGHLMDTGVDESGTITLLYPRGRIAQINFSSTGVKCAPTYIIGDKGTMHIPSSSWCPNELFINEEKRSCPLPDVKTNFDRSVGLQFEAEAARQAISKGLLEHPYATHDNSRLIMKIMCESVKQIGYEP